MAKEARIKYIPQMEVLWADFEELSDSQSRTSYSPGGDISGYFPQFPVLITSNRDPWTLGNLYLLRRLAFKADQYESETYSSIAKYLLKYLRFLENNGLDPLDFHPRIPFKRPTYLFRQYLLDRVQAGQLSQSTASSNINAVINFYKGLVSYGVLDSQVLDYVHKAKDVLIPIITDSGFSKLLTISSSDLAIKKQTKSKDPDAIQDGGSLFPLTKYQQEILFGQLRQSEQCIFLFFLFSLMTGARIQTVGTLRVETLKKARKNSDGDLIITVGKATKIDTKYGKNCRLHVPRILHHSLIVYANSATAKRRREKSFYGDIDNNYLFLNRNGVPYYTSKLEKQERRNPEHHRKVGRETSAKSFQPKNGEAIRKYIGEVLIPSIRYKNPSFPHFRFHDLRATFGMNLLETLLRHIDDHNETVRSKEKVSEELIGTQWALEQVQERMDHSNINTTMRYLNYRRNNQWRAKVVDEVEEQLMQYIPDNALQNLREH